MTFMKLLLAKLVPLIFIMGLSVVSLAGCAKQEDSSSELLEEARASGKPTLIQFGVSTAVCYPCIAMKVVLDEITEEYKDEINVILIDVEVEKALTGEFKVMMIPTQVLFNFSGEEVFRHSGYLGKDEIIIQLKEIGLE